MTRRLLVGIGAAREGREARTYLGELLDGLATMDVRTQVALMGRARPESELAAVADVRVMPPPRPRSPAGLAESLARRGHAGMAERIHTIRTGPRRRWINPPDCVHLNGPEAAPLLRYLTDIDVPITTYVHPRDFNIAGLQPSDRQRLLARTTRFLVADEEAGTDLIAHGADPARIELSPEPLIFPAPLVDPEVRATARISLGLPPDAFIIGVPPVPDWIEGPDLTLALAWELERQRPASAPLTYWYEMPSDSERRWPIEYDAARMGLTTLHIGSEVPRSISPFDLFDLVVLPARTSADVPDLFVTHASAHGTPVLCWNGHRLAPEVDRWTGGVVNQPDVQAMAHRVLALAEDAEERSRLRRMGRATVMAEIERLVPLQVPVP